jgi:amino acid transporter
MKILDRFKKILLGEEKDVRDPGIFHRISLIAFFAWVGLGADGLSSANYGPPEAFLSLGAHRHLALYLALLTAITVITISASYAQIIELFPTGGGGYVVATKLLGPIFGLVSGCALIVDYVLTISISLSIGVVDWKNFKGAEEIKNLEDHISQELAKYVQLAKNFGFYAETVHSIEIDTLTAIEAQCEEIQKKYNKAVFFVGKLVFEEENLFTRVLHSQTAFSIQRILQFRGIPTIVLPIRVMKTGA